LNDKENRLFGRLASIGKTVPSYRMAVEWEIANWKQFRNALSSGKQKQAFDELMDMCRTYASESSCATNPIIFEPMVMSKLLAQQVKIHKLEWLIKQQSGVIENGRK
jgi:hypothetical protein